ncbi:MAG: SdpI family protein [Candidatus Vogelbacteria bacterium]|nr:SdpI family protein [Candidatus Vogelbacteria bacterium]
MKNKYIASWLLAAGALISGLGLYPFLPAVMASHWGISGQVNGYQGKLFMVVFIPALSAVLTLIFWILPRLDPLGRNIASFRRHYDNFVLFLSAFLLYVHILSLVWNLGFKFNFVDFLTPAFALFIYGLGVVLPEARPNWIFGIRTPWTMSNGRVWFHTHELAGRVFRAAGVLTLGAFFWPQFAIYFLLSPVLFGAIYVSIFSYFDWRRETN